MQTEDIYSSPKAELIDEQNRDEGPLFFPSSILKLTLLYFATFGLYVIYWFYKNWKHYKERSETHLIPAARAVFYVFFTYSLFRKVKDESVYKEVESNWSAGLLATLFIILTVISNILDRLVQQSDTIGPLDYLSLLLLFLLVLPLVMVQQTINRINNDPGGESNSSFSVYNFIFFLLGSPLWLAILISYLDIDVSPILNYLYS